MKDQGTGGLLSPFLRKKRFAAARPFLRGKVLDVGCANGAFTKYISTDNYLGVDPNRTVLDAARQKYPGYVFSSDLPNSGEFDTIIALAVMEHIKDQKSWLERLTNLLAGDGKIVISTPHPRGRLIHDMGARLGIFSSDAAEEHEEFVDVNTMRGFALCAGLELIVAKTFLFGMNQLFVLEKSRA